MLGSRLGAVKERAGGGPWSRSANVPCPGRESPARLYKACTAHLARCGHTAEYLTCRTQSHPCQQAQSHLRQPGGPEPNIRPQPQSSRQHGTLPVSDVDITTACVPPGGLSSPSSQTGDHQA